MRLTLRSSKDEAEPFRATGNDEDSRHVRLVASSSGLNCIRWISAKRSVLAWRCSSKRAYAWVRACSRGNGLNDKERFRCRFV